MEGIKVFTEKPDGTKQSAQFYNMTPHDIVYRDKEGNDVVFPKSGHTIRVKYEYSDPVDIAGIPLTLARGIGLEGLPEDASEHAFYIVSSMTAIALGGVRGDIISPDSGDTAIRNEEGHIIAVTRFVAYWMRL